MNRVDAVPPIAHEAVDLDPQGVEVLDLAARSSVNAMVTASRGADRAALARTLHDRSPRRDGPFVVVCGQSYSAENRAVCGEDLDIWFERAAGGTLFIDQVGDLSCHAQRRFLSLLTEQSRDRSETTPHGHRQVRIIAGSNRSLCADLAVGGFSDALFYRLNVIHIDINQMDRDKAEKRL